MSEHYVFEGTEVKKTGRKAIKKVPIPGREPRQLELYEITPTDSDLDWKKWVRAEDLFKIVDGDDE